MSPLDATLHDAATVIAEEETEIAQLRKRIEKMRNALVKIGRPGNWVVVRHALPSGAVLTVREWIADVDPVVLALDALES